MPAPAKLAGLGTLQNHNQNKLLKQCRSSIFHERGTRKFTPKGRILGVRAKLCTPNVWLSFLLKRGSPQAPAKSGCSLPLRRRATSFQRAAGGFSGNSVFPRGVGIVKTSDFHGSNRARKNAFQGLFEAPVVRLLESLGIP